MVESLTDVHVRVLGSLVEKEATVPDTYPLTRNALVAACNQKNNREPVTALDDHTVQGALDELKARGLVRFVHPSHGARTTKFRHVLDEQLRLSPGELALLAVLMLRGPQTVNELRTRTERAHAFADNEAVEATLADLADRDDPLVVHLARQPGQKETRWMHLLAGPVDDDVPAGATDATVPAAPEPRPAVGATSAGLEARVGELEERVAALESVLRDLGVPASGNDDYQSGQSAGDTEPRESSPS